MKSFIPLAGLLWIVGCGAVSVSKTSAIQGAIAAGDLNKKHVKLVSMVPSNTCLDVPGARTHAGYKMQQYTCNGTHAQNFRFERHADGEFRIISIKGGKCLEPEGGGVADHTSIIVSNCSNSLSQKYRVLDQGNGLLRIINSKANKCLDEENISSDSGARVQLYNCNDALGQQWSAVDNPTPLRIMPLGASITQGVGSSHAGTRQYLHDFLTAENYPHVFVGSSQEQPGQLPVGQRQHEGHPGWTIENIPGQTQGVSERTREWVTAAQPDVVLILLGTNDVTRNNDIAGMGDRLYRMIDQISDLENGAARDARVLVASLPVINNPEQEARSLQYRDQIIRMADRFYREGKNVGFVDIHSVVKLSELSDSIHPNDAGHRNIARLWADRFLGRF